MPDENDVEFLRSHADKCRWLARQCSDANTAQKLRYMATDYEAQAAALERSRSPKAN